MNFIEILALFLCFCIISAVIDLIKLIIQGQIMKVQQAQRVDALFTSFIRAIVKYRLDAMKLFKGSKGAEIDG